MPGLFTRLANAVRTAPAGDRHRAPAGNGPITCRDGIAACIEQSRARIKSVRRRLDEQVTEAVIEGNAPFILQNDQTRQNGRAVLMVHGLTDSCFVMRDLAGFFHQQGFTVLAILLPGHGTCPGDLLNVHWRQWVQAHADAVDALCKDYRDVYLCGFSLGAALNLYHAVSDPRIKGLFLFAPALRLHHAARMACGLEKLGHWYRRLLWIDVQPDEDPYKYESIPANAVCQTYQLVKKLDQLLALRTPALPVFIAASDDDDPVCPSATVDLFASLPGHHKRLLYYSRNQTQLPPHSRRIQSTLPEKNIISSSHMAMIVAPDNPHYGERGDYAFCNHYYPSDPASYARCKARREDCLGETSLQPGSGRVLRRLTWNPWHDDLLDELKLFIEKIHN